MTKPHMVILFSLRETLSARCLLDDNTSYSDILFVERDPVSKMSVKLLNKLR